MASSAVMMAVVGVVVFVWGCRMSVSKEPASANQPAKAKSVVTMVAGGYAEAVTLLAMRVWMGSVCVRRIVPAKCVGRMGVVVVVGSVGMGSCVHRRASVLSAV
jgi:hypothetical protein